MAVTQRLEFRQTQSLVMTPQLQQAIKLLQLSNLELAEFVEKELEQNPLLERDEGGDQVLSASDGADGDDTSALDASDSDGEGTERDSLSLANAETLPSDDNAPLDTDYENLYDSTAAGDDGPRTDLALGADRRTETMRSDDGASLEQRLSQEPTLRQHLLNQLQLDVADPIDRLIGVHLIDQLDEAGYITGDLAAVATLLSCAPERVERTLQTLQAFDPPGIFARDLRECLALQLQDLNRLDPAMAALLDHLDLLAARNLTKLKQLCGVDDEDLADMIAEIKALDPKPALRFESQAAEPVVPDVLLRARPDGSWHLELNAETLPRVLVDRQYYARITKATKSKADRDYISEQFQAASWLVKSLHQRATTILKVASEIVRLQDGFFRKGVQHLRPLTLRDVAEAIEMHESTVSRVTANKYIETPRGTYELKYFFTAAIAGTAGGTHSAEAVRHRIKGLIDAEQASAVLSDDTLVDLLRNEGIEIARRTVAKYRESMRIPSSVQRRREKAANL